MLVLARLLSHLLTCTHVGALACSLAYLHVRALVSLRAGRLACGALAFASFCLLLLLLTVSI